MRKLGLLVLVLMSATSWSQPYYALDTALQRGYDLYYLGNYEEAGNAYFGALKRAQESGDKRLEAEAFRLLGEVNRASSNRPYALKYLNLAETLFSSIHDEYGIASTKNRKAAVYFEMGDSLNYMKYIQSSLKISRDNGFKDLEYNTLTILGAVQFVKALDYPGAIQTLTNALNIAEELNKVEDYPYIYNNLARLYQELGQLDSAVKYGEAALKIGEEFNIRTYIAAACGRLSLVYAALGDYEKAFAVERRYTMMMDTLGDESRDKVVAELVEKYQSEKQQEALSRQKAQIRYTLLAVGVLVIMLVVMLFLFINLRKQKEKFRKLSVRVSEQNTSLEEINVMKDRLLSVLSHDLRSPVAALSSTLEILATEDIPKDIQDSLLKELGERTNQTSQLLDNLLYWIKNQLNGISAQSLEVNVEAISHEVAAHFKRDLKTKNINLHTTFVDEPVVIADPELLRIILRNVLSNAIKFSSANSTIDLSAEKKDGEVIIQVQDHGVGMEKSQLEAIFSLKKKSFKGTNNELGAGIGLVLVRDLVEINKGKISVSSEPEKGTRIQISFPI